MKCILQHRRHAFGIYIFHNLRYTYSPHSTMPRYNISQPRTSSKVVQVWHFDSNMQRKKTVTRQPCCTVCRLCDATAQSQLWPLVVCTMCISWCLQADQLARQPVSHEWPLHHLLCRYSRVRLCHLFHSLAREPPQPESPSLSPYLFLRLCPCHCRDCDCDGLFRNTADLCDPFGLVRQFLYVCLQSFCNWNRKFDRLFSLKSFFLGTKHICTCSGSTITMKLTWSKEVCQLKCSELSNANQMKPRRPSSIQ